MAFARVWIVLAVIVAPYSCSGSATSQPTEIDYAHRLFEVGKFAEADEVYARIADQNAKNSSDHSGERLPSARRSGRARRRAAAGHPPHA
jgi:hypothetical protein